MEKYSQFRDRGSGIAPFFPISAESAGIYLPLHVLLFIFRVPLLITVGLGYILLCSWLPVGSLIKKAALWSILGVPGIWWIDLQIDGVKRGSLAKHRDRLPHPSTVIASSHTSPIDCLYLAAIFDPIFTASYSTTRLVQRISLFHAILRALLPPQPSPPASAKLIPLSQLLSANPDSAIVVLPECTTTNGRGILSFSPSLLSVPAKTKIFPVSLRYTPQDITTPVPGSYLSFLWKLCSKPTHSVRVRIAEAVYNKSVATPTKQNGYDTNYFDDSGIGSVSSRSETPNADGETSEEESIVLTAEEQKVLDQVGEDLARLGRVKRVGLTVKDKVDFIKVWSKTRKIS